MMKRVMKTIVTAWIAMMLILTAVPVMAKEYALTSTKDNTVFLNLPEKEIVTMYPNQLRATCYLGGTYNSNGEIGKKAKKVKVTATSSNARVASVKVTKLSDGATIIYTEPKKAGTTTIKVTANGKTYRTKVTVKKYVNPVSSIKIGKTTIKGATFNKTNAYTLKYSKFANKKMNVKINLKKGWKLLWGVGYAKKGWQKNDSIKNGAALKISGGKGFVISGLVKNTKTGQEESIAVYFK